MAVAEEQMQLIEVDSPEAKALKRLINKYEGLVEERKTAKEKENKARQSVVDKVREVGKPDGLGNIRIIVNGVTISIEPDEKVKIKHTGEDEIGGEEDDENDGKTPDLKDRK